MSVEHDLRTNIENIKLFYSKVLYVVYVFHYQHYLFFVYMFLYFIMLGTRNKLVFGFRLHNRYLLFYLPVHYPYPYQENVTLYITIGSGIVGVWNKREGGL